MRSGCPLCRFKGQKQVGELLRKEFPDFRIRTGQFLRLAGRKRFCDFWMESDVLRVMVEYDGIQHFDAIKPFGGLNALENQITKDVADACFCRDNDIVLHRISYSDDKARRVADLRRMIDDRLAGRITKEKIMSYDQKLLEVRKCIENFNAENSDGDGVNVDSFLKNLKKIGGINLDTLRLATFEDIEDCGCPRILARQVAGILRQTTMIKDSAYVGGKGAKRMSARELLEHYDPKDGENAVGKRLTELSKGQKFIIMVNGKVNVDLSLQLLEEIRSGHPGRQFYQIDGRPVPVYGVGESVGEFADESPLYPGRALRPDGTDDQLNRSWDGVSTTVRQLLRIAVHETREVALSHDKAHDLLDSALDPDAEKKLRRRYPKASMKLDEAIANGDAPKLRVRLGAAVNARGNDPFFQQHKTY